MREFCNVRPGDEIGVRDATHGAGLTWPTTGQAQYSGRLSMSKGLSQKIGHA